MDDEKRIRKILHDRWLSEWDQTDDLYLAIYHNRLKNFPNDPEALAGVEAYERKKSLRK